MERLERWLPMIILALVVGGVLLWAAVPKYSYSYKNGELVGVSASNPFSSECTHLSYSKYTVSDAVVREEASCYQFADEDLSVSVTSTATSTSPQVTITSVMLYDNGVRVIYNTQEALEYDPEVVKRARHVLMLGRNKFLKVQAAANNLYGAR